ncbi:MAG: cyclase family protein [Ignavibacteria bacterium]|nr:cyclase family protein [Ignavibacteria bacterium]
MSNSLIDLSHPIEHGLITYRGLPPPRISEYQGREESRRQYADGTEFLIGKIEMVANTGTYLDSPFHRYPDGKDLSQLPLGSLANLDGVVMRKKDPERAIDQNIFENIDVRGKAVLVHTGWDRYWNTNQYFEGNPFLTKMSAEYLVRAGAALVGIDSVNIDNTDDLTRPAHTVLLAADIPIVEHLCNLGSIPEKGFKFFAVPTMIKNFSSFPVRAFAIV